MKKEKVGLLKAKKVLMIAAAIISGLVAAFSFSGMVVCAINSWHGNIDATKQGCVLWFIVAIFVWATIFAVLKVEKLTDKLSSLRQPC